MYSLVIRRICRSDVIASGDYRYISRLHAQAYEHYCVHNDPRDILSIYIERA